MGSPEPREPRMLMKCSANLIEALGITIFNQLAWAELESLGIDGDDPGKSLPG